MTYVVYPDVLILFQSGINFLLLCLLNRFLNKQQPWYKLLCYSILTSISVNVITIFSSTIGHLALDIVYVLLYSIMLIFCFKCKRTRDFVRIVISFLILEFLFYGMIRSFKNINGDLRDGICYKDYFLFIVIFLALLIVITSYSINMKSNANFESNLNQVSLVLHHQSIELNGFLDTGNHLYDVLINKPVLVLDYRATKQIFNEILYIYVLDYVKTGNFSYEEVGGKLHIYPVLYQTIGKEISFLPTFICDELIINDEKYEKIPIGISRTKLQTNHSEKYTILLNEDLKTYKEENSND